MTINYSYKILKCLEKFITNKTIQYWLINRYVNGTKKTQDKLSIQGYLDFFLIFQISEENMDYSTSDIQTIWQLSRKGNKVESISQNFDSINSTFHKKIKCKNINI